MSWARLDDQMAFHPKVVMAGNEAVGAWARAIAWCAAHLTDGVVPWHVAITIASKKTWMKLIEIGLIDDGKDPNYLIVHDFLTYNPTAESVRRERARKARNIADMRCRRRSVTGNVTGYEPDTNRGVTAFPIPIPIPNGEERESAEREIGALPQTPPATPGQPPSVGDSQTSLPGLAHAPPPPPAPKPAKKAARGSNGADRTTRLPEGFAPSEQHRSLAKEFDVDLGVVFPKFVDHHMAKGSRFIDWDAALRTWIRNSNTYDRVGPTRKQAPRESNLPDITESRRPYARPAK
jgi:hypothetical protein